MRSKIIPSIFLVVALISFISASGFSGNGYYDEATDQCWPDKEHPVGGEYPAEDTDSTGVGLFQCCMNYYKQQINCSDSSQILYPKSLEITIESPDEEELEDEMSISLTTNIPAKCEYNYGYKYNSGESEGDVSIGVTFWTSYKLLTNYYTLKHSSSVELKDYMSKYEYLNFKCIANTEEEVSETIEINIKEFEEIDNTEEEVEDQEETQEDIIAPVTEIIQEDTAQTNQVSEIVKSSSKKSSKKSEDKNAEEELILQEDTKEDKETETIKMDNEVIVLKSGQTEKGVLVLFIKFISNLFS